VSGCDVILSIDGGRSNRRFSGSPVYDEDGHVTHAVVTFFDITDQKRMAQDLRISYDELHAAEHELRVAYETVRLALDGGASGAWSLDIQSGALTWSESYYRLLGIDPAVKPSPELFYSLVHPGDLKRVQASFNDAVQGKISDFRTEFRIQRSDGVRWLERRGRMVPSGIGRRSQVVGITTDITERKILRGLLPTCAQCKKIRDENDHWQVLEKYISEHSEARFSHGVCPECAAEWAEASGIQMETI
jgi:PAS domain S-box-containing protein